MGAIMVLFLFVLMLLNLNKDTEPLKSNMVKIVGVIAGCCFVVTLVGSLKASSNIGSSDFKKSESWTGKELG